MLRFRAHTAIMTLAGGVVAAGCSSSDRAPSNDGAAVAPAAGAAGTAPGGVGDAGVSGAPVAGAAAGVAIAGGASSAGAAAGSSPTAGTAGTATGAGPGCGPPGGTNSGGAGGQLSVAGAAGTTGGTATAGHAGASGVAPTAGAGGAQTAAGAAGATAAGGTTALGGKTAVGGTTALGGNAGSVMTGGVGGVVATGGAVASGGAAGVSGMAGTAGSQSGWTCGDALVDARDDRVYGTVLLGGVCWMAKNLDIGERIDATIAQSDSTQIQKYCLNNDPAMCDTYGGLYQWDQVMDYVETQGANGICPADWHVPSDQEWKDLEIALGMTPVQADQIDWRGAPVGTALKVGGSSGFEAPLSGMSVGGSFYNYPTYGYYWTSTLGPTYSPPRPWRRCLTSGGTYSPETVGRWETWPRDYALPVRCVRDQ